MPPKSKTAAGASAKRLLVVDDDASVREMLNRVLTGEGYAVTAVPDGESALVQARVSPVDLVLLDLTLPPTDGWDVLGRLRALHPSLPVIIVTARSGEAPAAHRAGADALLEKPLDYPTLLRTIADTLLPPVAPRLARGAAISQP
jgi:DNA-binding response OmpR family regulator